MIDAWWSLPLTVVAYLLARKLAAKINISIVNPLLVAMAIVIPILLLTHFTLISFFAG